MTRTEALSKAMKLCSIREYAFSEIEQKLTNWEILPADRIWILDQLRNDKFIDEFRMARSFANDKMRYNKWGKLKIGYMLRQKNVSPTAITEALDQIDPVQYRNILKAEIAKKRREIKVKDDYTIRAKLFRFATGRGFESDMIYRLLDEL